MITLVKDLPDINVRNVVYVKLMCHYAAYKDYDKIALFWCQTDEMGTVTAIISLIDNNMTLCRSGGDLDELKSFITALSPANIFTDLNSANALCLNIVTKCASLYKKPPFNTENAAENTYEGLDFTYSILSEFLSVGEKDAFIGDVSHRIRHNTAGYVTTKHSAGVILYCENYATLAGIAVKSDVRRGGLGSATLSRLLEIIRDRTVFICAEYKNVPFYENNGFTVESYAAYCTL